MLFFHPMWDHESERIGKQKCTPVGYAIHAIADLLGFVGLLLLLGALVYLSYRITAGTFRAALFWLVAAPVGLGLISDLLFHYSWWLARRKGFRYDVERCEATWIESGEQRSYKCET